jgi:hypothetical protein
MKRFIYQVLTALILSGASCSADGDTKPEEQLLPVPAGHVHMQINVPGLSTPETYALNGFDECEVREVDVLVFDNSNNMFLCHARGKDIADASGATNGNAKTFIVDLSDAGDVTSVQVMVIANAHGIVADAVNTFDELADEPAASDVMAMLEFSCPGKWNVTKSSAGDFTPFPMWGMETVDLSDIESIQAISLMRAVAKIDVGLDFSGDAAQGLSTFKLESVRLYNSHGKGSVSPYSGNYSGATASIVSVPASPGSTSPNPVPYDKTTASDGFSGDVSCMNAIYMAEHAAGTVGSSTNACLVIGGKYNGEASTTWYRIDFVNSSGAYLPVLRNHRYKVNIKSVDCSGYASVQEALTGESLAAVQISVTNESLTSHAYNKDYALSVMDALTLANNALNTTGVISLSTSYPGGYTTAVTSTGNWLAISGGGSSTTATTEGQVNTITVRATSANTTGSSRTGTVTVTSGSLTRVVTVTQPAAVVAKTFSVTEQASFPDNGTQQTLTVTSDSEWYVKVSRGYDVVSSFDAYGSGNRSFRFTLTDNFVDVCPSATFTFYSPTGEFPPINRIVSLRAYLPGTHGGLAGSNIYWDGSRLTFDDVGVTTHENYQGVYFRWGGLYGVDPSGSQGSYWSTSNIVYLPAPESASGWSVATGYAWADIPYANDIIGNLDNRGRAILYEFHDPSVGRGDICRYITEVAGGTLHGKKWRMPVSNEFEYKSGGSGETLAWSLRGTYDSSGGATSDKSDGTFRYSGVSGATTSSVFFPASGHRTTSGILRNVGYTGYYWSSSVYDGSLAYSLGFNSGTVSPANSNDRASVVSVRCVRDL